jgi:hypothetical protein
LAWFVTAMHNGPGRFNAPIDLGRDLCREGRRVFDITDMVLTQLRNLWDAPA